MNIKTFFVGILASLFVFSMTTLPAQAQDVIPIPIYPGHGGGNIPRSPTLIPIQASLSGSNLIITFSYNVGDVDITIASAESSVCSTSQVADSSTPCFILSCPPTSGDYVITFTLASGVSFYGEFSINI